MIIGVRMIARERKRILRYGNNFVFLNNKLNFFKFTSWYATSKKFQSRRERPVRGFESPKSKIEFPKTDQDIYANHHWYSYWNNKKV